MIMKKYLITTALCLTLAAQAGTAAADSISTHRPVTAAVQKKAAPKKAKAVKPADDEGLEAFSDTTSSAAGSAPLAVDDTTNSQPTASIVANVDANDILGHVFDNMESIFLPIAIVSIIFFLAPVALLALILYFIYKNRKQRLRMAEMAMEKGYPLPEKGPADRSVPDDVMWRKGIKNIFLGIGLAIFLSYLCSPHLGTAIGALVFFNGVGQAVIARTSSSRRNDGHEDGDKDLGTKA